jgi:hypothetical protein
MAVRLAFTVIGPTQKVLPNCPVPSGDTTGAQLFGARNEFVSFQVVIGGRAASNVRLVLGKALAGVDETLAGVGETIPAANVTIYREEYYTTTTASTAMRPIGRWPDALIPSVDPLYGEERPGFAIATLPAGENRVFWVDVLVPMTQQQGLYEGELVLRSDGLDDRPIPVRLEVRNFTLPSTSSLRSLFKIHPRGPFRATYPQQTTRPPQAEVVWAINYDYARIALENRITIANIQFQAPAFTNPPAIDANVERYQLPLINGTAETRLRGARTTTFAFDTAENWAAWKQQAELGGFADRSVLYALQCDEPKPPKDGAPPHSWSACKTAVEVAHGSVLEPHWPKLPNVVTASIQEVNKADFLRYTDILAPLISQMHGDTQMHVDENWSKYVGNQRECYNDFLKETGKEVWMYTSCIAVDCIGDYPDQNKVTPDWEGWADYTIDAAASQNRAMGWLAYLYDVSGELYYAVDQRLARFDEDHLLVSTAWTDQWFAGGNGDGTLFYPWDKDRVGGKTAIPIESMRMKLIRNGHQDYEYLRLAGVNKKGDEARAIARKLYPSTFETIATDAEVEAARLELAGLAEGVKGTVALVGSLSVKPTEPTVQPTGLTGETKMTASFKVTNDGGNQISIKDLVTAVRDSNGKNVDFQPIKALTLQPGEQRPYTASRGFGAGTYTAWAAYYDGTQWQRLLPEVKFIVK